LKESGFVSANRYGRATPNWEGFAQFIARSLDTADFPGLKEAMRFRRKRRLQAWKSELSASELATQGKASEMLSAPVPTNPLEPTR
jgi:hypothetical protein